MPYIEGALARLSVEPKSIRISVLNKSVSFLPPTTVSRSEILNALADSGFDVECESGTPSSVSSLVASALQARRRKRTHFRNCEACKVDRKLPIEPVPETRLTDTYDMSMSIGGMTCAACVSAIADTLWGIDGVSEINIDLLGRSGTAVLTGRDKAEEIKTTIEDIGYECEVVSVKRRTPSDVKRYRAILGIRGMTCARCETVISRALNSLECVQSANVDFANNSAEVLLTHNIADAKHAVEEKGYGPFKCKLTKVYMRCHQNSSQGIVSKKCYPQHWDVKEVPSCSVTQLMIDFLRSKNPLKHLG